MANSETILNIARGWLGCNEKDNTHKQIIDVYNAHTPLARGYKVKYTDSWCATFVSACAIKAGCTNIIPTECSCNKMIELFQKIGCWQENESVTPASGWIIFYDWQDSGVGDNKGSSEHVGIVEKVANGVITVIEGNKNDSVARRTLKVNGKYIRGYGVPKYNSVNVKPIESEKKATLYKVKVNTPSGLNCRKKPSTSAGIVTAYANNTPLDIIAESNGWGETKDGWVLLKYTTKVNKTNTTSNASKANGKALGKYKTTAKPALKVREGAGENYDRVPKHKLTKDGQAHSNENGGLLPGTSVTVLEWVGDWARIPSGFVKGTYLVKV
jgi:hypothetical protein